MSNPFPTVRPMTPIITDNERLLLKAAKDVLAVLEDERPQPDYALKLEHEAVIHRLRRAVEIVEASDGLPREQKETRP